LTVGFRPQFVVVSGLSVGIPLTMGFRPQLVVLLGLSVGIPFTVGFRLSQCLWLSRSLFTNSSSFHDGILAITKPFHTKFFFLHDELFSFFAMEFWLPGSLSHEIFFFHNGISAITKPFHDFSSFTMELWLSRSLFTNFSSFTMESWLSRSLFTNFSFTMELYKMHDLGENSFHIYHI
jgi:hypothetical protein